MLLHADLLNCGDYFIELMLWLLGAFILGYLLRWILGAKYRDKVSVLEKDLEASRAKATDLEANLSSAKYDRDKTAEELEVCKRSRDNIELQLKACKESLENLKNEDS